MCRGPPRDGTTASSALALQRFAANPTGADRRTQNHKAGESGGLVSEQGLNRAYFFRGSSAFPRIQPNGILHRRRL
jgi:hypothetical protein